MKTEKVETDVLCVGGGIAGMMAAIRARDLGARVVVAEKSNTLRSGAGGMGNDHFIAYIPEIHGPDIDSFARWLQNTRIYAYMMRPLKFFRTRLERSSEIVKLWDSWGIPMKYKGKYEYLVAGGAAEILRYEGWDQKVVLTKQARKRGVQIRNRVMVFDLLHDRGTVVGAVGYDSMNDRMVQFHARSVILGTGKCVRLYPGPTPGWMFNIETSPVTNGDGRAMAYRAGAELANMERLYRWAGMKYFSRCGKGTWIGVIRDAEGKPLGPYLTRPEKYGHGDPVADENSTVFEESARTGRGPYYMSCQGISDENLKYMKHWLKAEGSTTVLNYLEEEGIDVKKEGVEFMTYEQETWGGIPYNEKGETSVKGLYAAGDEYGDMGSQAAVFGWIAGENAAWRARRRAPKINAARVKAQVKANNNLMDKIRSRESGATWQEVNVALQQVMQDYAGPVRSGPVLKGGLSHLRKLKQKARESIMAKNPHELMRCLEVLNMLDLGELVFVAAIERRETRPGFHVRSDYPFADPKMEKPLIIKMKNGKPVTEWREKEKEEEPEDAARN